LFAVVQFGYFSTIFFVCLLFMLRKWFKTKYNMSVPYVKYNLVSIVAV